jgi:uncharacterized protein (DUF2141 family)
MKKFLFISLAISCIFSNHLFSQFKLEVEIAGLRNKNGNVLMELYTDTHILIKQEKLQIKNNICIVTFDGLKPSKYAIRYFHDENENIKLDKNWAGVPTEGYGFSNNVLGTFGPPDFDKWIFELKDNAKLKLKIKYH